MASIVLTLPIVAGKVEAWRRFCQEMSGSRLVMYEASRKRLGITHEQLALVETDEGSAVVATLEASDVGRALGQLITSTQPFDRWYREQAQELYGMNLAGYELFLQTVKQVATQKVHFEWGSIAPLLN